MQSSSYFRVIYTSLLTLTVLIVESLGTASEVPVNVRTAPSVQRKWVAVQLDTKSDTPPLMAILRIVDSKTSRPIEVPLANARLENVAICRVPNRLEVAVFDSARQSLDFFDLEGRAVRANAEFATSIKLLRRACEKFTPSSSPTVFDWSSDGKAMTYSTGTEVVYVDIAAGAFRQLRLTKSNTKRVKCLAISPARSQLAIALQGTTAYHEGSELDDDLWLSKPIGSSARRLGVGTSPCWRSDSRAIAYTEGRDGRGRDVWIVGSQTARNRRRRIATGIDLSLSLLGRDLLVCGRVQGSGLTKPGLHFLDFTGRRIQSMTEPTANRGHFHAVNMVAFRNSP